MKYETIGDLVNAVRTKQEDTDNIEVVIDNDHVYAHRPTGGTDEFGDPDWEEVWKSEYGPAYTLEELLTQLGVTATQC